MDLLVSWLVLSLGLWLTALVVPGFEVKGVKGALVVGAVFGLLHFFVGWLLFVVIGLGTLFLGFIFAFVTWWLVSAILLKVTDAFTESLRIDSFKTALLASFVLSILSVVREYVMR